MISMFTLYNNLSSSNNREECFSLYQTFMRQFFPQINDLSFTTSLADQAPYQKDTVPFTTEVRQAQHILTLSLKQFNNKSIATKHNTLPPRQYDILRWIADGLKLQDIADNKVHRSIHTINKDLHTLKRILDANTNEELVAKGLRLGLIN